MEKDIRLFDVCVICALPEEVRAFLEIVQPHCEGGFEEHISPRYGYSFRSATLKNNKDQPLILHISWLPRYGPSEMTLHLSRVLEECRPRIAIMTGFCAGDARRVQLGDLVIAERTFTYDNGRFTIDDAGRRIHEPDTMTYQLDANVMQFLGVFDDWKPLVAHLKRPPSPPEQRKRRKIACHIKPMASGSAVRADHPFEEVQAPVRGTVAIDMEGAALGLVMSRHPHIPWLVVKGVCDYADQGKSDVYHDYAARASALYALSFIRAYVTYERLPRLNLLQTATPPEPVRSLKPSWQPFTFLRLLLLIVFVLGVIMSGRMWLIQQNTSTSQGTRTNRNVTITATSIPLSSTPILTPPGAEFHSPSWAGWFPSAPWSLSNDKRQLESTGKAASCDLISCDTNKVMLFAPFQSEGGGTKRNYAVEATIEMLTCANVQSPSQLPFFGVFARGTPYSGHAYTAGIVVLGSTQPYGYYGSYIAPQPHNARGLIANSGIYHIRLELKFVNDIINSTVIINNNLYSIPPDQDKNYDTTGRAGLADYGCQIRVIDFKVSPL